MRLQYRLDGPQDAPVLVLVNSLGTDLHMWDRQVRAFSEQHLVLRFDVRGQGGSSVPASPYTLERLGRDLIGLLDHLGVQRASICGVSLGGMIAQWVAVHEPDRVERVVLANTASRIGSHELWETRIAAVRAGGMVAIRDAVLDRFFTPEFRADAPEAVGPITAVLDRSSAEGYVGCCSAIRDADLRDVVPRIRALTLVVAADRDLATPPADAWELHGSIVGSELAVLTGAAHLANVERPDEFNQVVLQFLARVA